MIKKLKSYSLVAIGLLIGFFGYVCAQEYGYVNTYALKVRQSISMNSKVIGIVYKGSKVTVIQPETNGWKKVQLENGRIGYVNGKFLDFEDELESKTKQNVAYNVEKGINLDTYEISVNKANIRSLKNVDKKIGTLSKGDKVILIDDSKLKGYWMRVMVTASKDTKLLGLKGYIGKNMLQKIETQSIPAEPLMDSKVSFTGDNSQITGDSTAGALSGSVGTDSLSSSSSSSTSSVQSTSSQTDASTEEILSELFNF